MFKYSKILTLSIIIITGFILSGCASSDNSGNLISAGNQKIAGAEAVEMGESPEEPNASLYFFWGDGCPHCADQKVFLQEMKEKYPDLEILMYETWKNTGNAKALQKIAKAYGVSARGVPMTFIGDNEPFVGFSQRMEANMEDNIKYCIENTCVDPANKL
jgi:thiol-disulfide isomerase/thioredoxin